MNADSPKVSILIPCFNAQRWIGPCIDSALAQSVSDKEVIIVDDGSTDRSLEIVKSFGDKIRFEAGPNRGGNAARNRLLELAQGQWVQFLDADDYLKPDKIEQQLKHAEDVVDVVYSPVCIETWVGDLLQDRVVHGPDTKQSLEEQWIRWHVAQTGSVLWRRHSLKRIGGWNEQYPCCQDNEVTMRAIHQGLQFVFCPDAYAVYRIWSDNTLCRKDPYKVIEFKTGLIEQMEDWLKKKERFTEPHLAAVGQTFFEMARTLASYNLSVAHQFAKERKQKGLFHVCGPAASRNYRLVYWLLGFRGAEKVAQWVRKLAELIAQISGRSRQNMVSC
jgi:glycosyltransferase involved in cell wall biosynthesis